MTDIFTEVEDEFRKERLKSAWRRFGVIPIGLAVLLVLATAGYQGYQFWRASTAARDGDRFVDAVALADDDNHTGAREALLSLADEGTAGYAVIARFRAATESANAGDTQGAITAFRALANDNQVPEAYRDLAEIRAGYLAVDGESYEDLVVRLGTYAEAEGGWRFNANEILGLAAFKADDLETARSHFAVILEGAGLGAGGQMSERARVIEGLIRGRLGEPAVEAEAEAPPELETSVDTDENEVAQ